MSATNGVGREIAYRLFAAEYDDTTLSYAESDEERAPNYVVTPTGARINRAFVVGTLTEVTSVNEEMVRARVVDPTGAFVVYAGQYQPDELAFLERTDPPAFVAVTGKARTFEPDDGDRIYTSIRPESLAMVDADTRDRWVIGAAEQTLHRVATYAAAAELDVQGDQLADVLRENGVSEALAEGIPLAQNHYGTTPAYLDALRECALDAVRVVAGETDQVDPLEYTPSDAGTGDTSFGTLAAAGDVSFAEPEPSTTGVSDTEPTSAGGQVDSAAGAAIGTAGSGSTDDVESETVVDDASGGIDDGSTDSATADTEGEPAGVDAQAATTDASEAATDTVQDDETDFVDSTDETDSVDSTDETDSVDSTDETDSVGDVDETDAVDTSERSTEDTTAADVPDSADDATDTTASAGDSMDADAADTGLDDLETDFDDGDFDDELDDGDLETEPDDDDLGDFEAGEFGDGMYEMDEEEREEIESEFGTEFTTGADVDEPGESDIDVPDPDPAPADTAGDPADAGATPSDGTADDGTQTSVSDSEATDEPAQDSGPSSTESTDEVDETASTGTEPAVDDEPAGPAESTADESAADPAESAAADESTADPAETSAADESADEPAEDVDLQSYVVETMRDLDDGDGAARGAVIDAVTDDTGAPADDVDDAIQDALMGGQCYEPDDETLKPI